MPLQQDTLRSDSAPRPAEIRVSATDSNANTPEALVPVSQPVQVTSGTLPPSLQTAVPEITSAIPDTISTATDSSTTTVWVPVADSGKIMAVPPPEPRSSFFGVQLPVNERINHQSLHNTSNAAMLIVLVILVTLVSRLRYADNKRMKEYFIALFNPRFSRQLFREEKIAGRLTTLLFGLTTWLTWSWLFTYIKFELSIPFGSDNQLLAFVEFSGLILGLYLVKKLATIICGSVFENLELIREHNFNVVIFNSVSAIAILPVLAVAFLSSETLSHVALLVAIGLAGMAYIARLSKLLYTGITGTTVSGLYIILYICTLEILPVAVMVKLYLSVVGR